MGRTSPQPGCTEQLRLPTTAFTSGPGAKPGASDAGAQVAMLAHELRRRIAAARVAAEGIVVLRERGDAPWALVDRLIAELHDLDHLGQRILADRTGQPADVVDPVIVAEAAARTVRSARGADVRVNAEPACGEVRVDAVLLRQALENLIENAHQHSGGGPVEVAVRRSRRRGTTEILVADRGGAAPSAAGGHGIGLDVVHRLVSARGSELWTEPRPGGGTVVGLRLPHGGQPRRELAGLALAGAQGRL